MRKKLNFVLIVVIVMLTIVPNCLSEENQIVSPDAMSYPLEGDYIIGAGDLMEIVTWKEPDFSREDIFVRLDGKITFPLLGDLQAAGKTPTQLKNDIQERLKEYITGPEVTITIRSMASKRYYILGEVEKTGEYPLVKNLTVLQAFAVAGGFSEWASKKEIILVRRSNEKDEMIRINYKEIIKGKNIEQNVKVKADDTIIVP
jgi:polysaccharide export outer membrane protein